MFDILMFILFGGIIVSSLGLGVMLTVGLIKQVKEDKEFKFFEEDDEE